MAFKNRVVAHHLDGRVLKGTTQDFIPTHPSFHILSIDGEPAIEVKHHELKALFFVKDLDGSKLRVDVPAFTGGPLESAYGKKLAVRFPDGELLCGYSLAYNPASKSFFMSTMDAQGNNERIFVFVSPGVNVLEGQAAEEMLRSWSNNEAA